MELADAIRARRMVRRYDATRPVPDAVVDRLLQHAVRAPSAGMSLGWDFLVLRSAAERDTFWQAATPPDGTTTSWLDGMRAAPVLVVCLSDPDAYLDRYARPDKAPGRPELAARDRERWPVPYWDVDTGMAALLMLLTAVDEGLGACFFGVPAERHDDVREAFGIPASRRVVGVVSVGEPEPGSRSSSSRRRHRTVADTAHAGRFGVPWPPPAPPLPPTLPPP